jgi:hypothetical protein
MNTVFTGKLITIALCLGIVLSLSFLQGCKKPEPARVTIVVEGQLFSDAMVLVDGKQAGKLVQTLITPEGKLYIDGIHTVTLPPGHSDIPERDDYEGTLDSMEMKAGEHTILLQTEDGKTLQIKADVPPGRHLVTYLSDEEKLTWNNTKLEAAPGSTVTIKTAN